MGAIRKPRFSDGDVEKAMDGFFNNLLVTAGWRHVRMRNAPVATFIDQNQRYPLRVASGRWLIVRIHIENANETGDCRITVNRNMW